MEEAGIGTQPDLMPDGDLVQDSEYRDLADFRYGIRLFVRFSEEQALQAGITPQQHQLLLAVRGHPSYPSVNIRDIADRLQIRHHSASQLVERCVRRRLLHRQEDPVDRRRALISLTDDGQDLLDRLTRANRQELLTLEDTLFRESLHQALHAHERPT